MPAPKKNPKVKIYDTLEGSHTVSPDGTHVKIGDTTFRRTVLPSVAVPRAEDQNLNSELESIDDKTIAEVED